MMKRIAFASGLLVLLSAFAFTACNKNDDNGSSTDNFDRKAMLTNYADNYVIPGYAEMVRKLDDLKTLAEQFTAAPDEGKLIVLRNSWKEAYTVWQKVELLEFGPAEDISLRMYINIYPVTVGKLNNNIATGVYDLESFGNKDAQGFPAVDYLLNGLGGSDAAIVSQYTTDGLAGNRKQYLLAVIGKMLEKVKKVNTDWVDYRNTFIENTGTDVNSSLSRSVNAFVLYYERYLRSGKIGLPAGAMTGMAKPELVEAYYTPALSKELALTALTAVKKFYEGINYNGSADGIGMRDYLAAIGTKDDNGQPMADLIVDELDEATGALQGLGGTLKDDVVNNRPAVLGLYDELQDVVPLFKVDMVSAFGISITYVDNDGD